MPLLLLASVVVLLLTGFVWQLWSEKSDRRRCPAPGASLTIDGCALHVNRSGSGQPPVILESGIAASSVGWVQVQPQIAEFTQVCVYDRPGFGWTERSTRPRTPDQFLQELGEVVRHCGTPVILVGHSFGGLLVQLYAAHYPEDIAGLVLVDPALVLEWASPAPAQAYRLRRGIALARRGAWLAKIGFVRLSLNLLTGGGQRFAKVFARAAGGQGASTMDRLVGEVRKLPPELWPVIQSHWCRPSSFRSMADHLASLPQVAAAVACNPLPARIPVTVISGGHLSREHLREHEEIAGRSRQGVHIVAERSGHWIHLDRPELVVGAVRNLIADTVRV